MISHRFFRPITASVLLFGILFAGSGTTFSLAVSEETADGINLETNDGFDFFSVEYKSGVTYVQTAEMTQTTTMTIAGQEMDQVVESDMTNEMTVDDLPEGGKSISIVFTHVAMDMETMGTTMHYDSNDKNAKNDPVFGALGALVGDKMTMLVDDDYNIVEIEQDEETLEMLKANELTKDLASPKQFVQSTRLAQSLPTTAVAPGDTWEFDMNYNGLMRFAGTGTLVGFNRDCGNGQEKCAEIRMEGTFDMNMEEFGEALGEGEGGDLSEVLSSIKITDGVMRTTLYWDNTEKFARLTETKTTMTMLMDNPADGSTMEIPTEQSMKITVDMME